MSSVTADGPVVKSANRSPSWISVLVICFNTARTCGVSNGWRWKSSTNSRKIRPGAVATGRDVGRMMPSGAARVGGACTLKTRPPCTSSRDAISCGWPSSNTMKSSTPRSGTNRPSRSRTMTSVVTSWTSARKTGCWGRGAVEAVCLAPSNDVAEPTNTTHTPVTTPRESAPRRDL